MMHSISLHSERALINDSHDNGSTEEGTHTVIRDMAPLLLISTLSFCPPQLLERTSRSSVFPLPCLFLSLKRKGHLTLVFSLPQLLLVSEDISNKGPQYASAQQAPQPSQQAPVISVIREIAGSCWINATGII